MPWDKTYYLGQLRSQRVGEGGTEWDNLFTVGGCMDGFNELIFRLFGVRLRPCVDAARRGGRVQSVGR